MDAGHGEEVEVDDQVERAQPIEPGNALVEHTLDRLQSGVLEPANTFRKGIHDSHIAPDFTSRPAR